MATMAQRIELLREEKGLSRPALAAALGLPKNAPEKFETGRATPTKEQQEKLADFFGVSIFYLKGESGDRTRQDSWMEAAYNEPETVTTPMVTRKAPKPAAVSSSPAGEGTLFDAFGRNKAFQDMVRSTVLEVLRSPEGQEILGQVIRKELQKH